MTIHEETYVLQEPPIGEVSSLINQSVSRTFTLLGLAWRVWKKTWSSCEEGALRLLDDKADLENATQWSRILQEVIIQEIAHLQETLREATQQKCRWVGWGRGGDFNKGWRVPEDIDTEILISNNGYGHLLSRHTIRHFSSFL